jgi:hypothetical protein
MKNYWLLSCCFLLAFSSFGQGRDTVLAVHKLFKQQRPKGYEVATAGAGLLIQPSASVTERIAVATASGTSYALLEALQNRRFQVEREALILQQYAQGIPIPADIRRRLHGALFKRTAKDVRNGF